jgi:hypothetical protein
MSPAAVSPEGMYRILDSSCASEVKLEIVGG